MLLPTKHKQISLVQILTLMEGIQVHLHLLLTIKVVRQAIPHQQATTVATLEISGSPCPANKGLIGKEAQLYWEQYPELRPDFEQYQIRQEQIKLNKQAQKQVVYDRYIAEAKK